MNNSKLFKFKPLNKNIERVVRNCSHFLKLLNFPDEAIQNQETIIRELIKNGIKYGSFNPHEYNVTLNIHAENNFVTVEVINPVNEFFFGRLKKLDQMIQFINGFQDPYQAYQIKQMEFFNNPLPDAIDDLILTRVACMGNTKLDFFVDSENFLKLSAVGIY